MIRVNGGCCGQGWAGIKRQRAARSFERSGNPMTYVITEPCIGTKDQSCVEVCPVDCIYDAGDHFMINPRGVHRLRRLRAGVPGRSHLPRGRGPRGPGELHHQGRRVLRVARAQSATLGRGSGPSLYLFSRLYTAPHGRRELADARAELPLPQRVVRVQGGRGGAARRGGHRVRRPRERGASLRWCHSRTTATWSSYASGASL